MDADVNPAKDGLVDLWRKALAPPHPCSSSNQFFVAGVLCFFSSARESPRSSSGYGALAVDSSPNIEHGVDPSAKGEITAGFFALHLRRAFYRQISHHEELRSGMA
ncbi:hypothetical protein [Bradyrhizobium sp. LTSPM299]|uniref:hypothetical protein n=1 Tax=Bradyrhizobium sp. LTSPM299 TaxID=1619233 RepID=UPI000AF41FD5|nr:hypothetical protein [Bradyrhizobium sp. LTSPM299]